MLIVGFLCSSAHIPVITIDLLVKVKVHCEWILSPFSLGLTIFDLHGLKMSAEKYGNEERVLRVLFTSGACLSSKPLRTLLY